jgi:hypothetical protein
MAHDKSISINKMNKLIVFTIFSLLCCSGVYCSNRNSRLVQDVDPAIMPQKRSYGISTDSVKAILKVIQYSKAIIDYEITITTANGKIEQKGYALNLCSEMNSGVEYETDDNGKELQVVAYHSYLCSCGDPKNLEIRISTDGKKVSIYSSRKLRHDLFNDEVKDGDKLEDSVQLFGYLIKLQL